MSRRVVERPRSRYTAPSTASIASARMLVLSRPPDISSPFPRRTSSPSPRSRATSAREVMLTVAARSFASSPSFSSGNSRKARSVMISPSTASPRNSRRSLVTFRAFSKAKERCVSAASARARSRNRTRTARPRAPASRVSESVLSAWPCATYSTSTACRPA